MTFCRFAVCLAFGLSALAAAAAEPVPGSGHLYDASGRLRYRIARHSSEVVDVPDVITLKDGSKLEAYFLHVYRDWFVFYLKETETSWVREEIPRSEVKAVDAYQYLPEDPTSPRQIVAAAKQPVPKEAVLAGVFAAESRNSRWRLTFRSRIDRHAGWSEDATDYGEVTIESSFSQRAGGKLLSRRTEARAGYNLYRPGTVRNDEWVLVLFDIVQRESDQEGREITLGTTLVSDETFILYFSPQEDAFRLAWSNLGGWTWASLTGIRFERAAEDEVEPSVAPKRRAHPTPFLPRAGAAQQILVRTEAERVPPTAAHSSARSPLDSWKAPPSRIQGWTVPEPRWR